MLYPGRKRCAVCLSKELDAAHRRARSRRKAGQCVKCGAADPPGRYCLRCSDKDRARYARRRASSNCVKCGKRVSAPGKQICLTCRARCESRRLSLIVGRTRGRQYETYRRLKQARLDAGKCPRCTAPLVFGRHSCADCLGDKRACASRAQGGLGGGKGLCLRCGHARDDARLHCGRLPGEGIRLQEKKPSRWALSLRAVLCA